MNELKHETSEKGILSNKINNDIIMNKYRIYEEKDKSIIILHKRVNDYYIVLKFNEIKLKMDVKKIMELRNEHLREVRKTMKLKDTFAKVLNLELENDQNYKSLQENDYYKDLGEGDLQGDKENFEVERIN